MRACKGMYPLQVYNSLLPIYFLSEPPPELPLELPELPPVLLPPVLLDPPALSLGSLPASLPPVPPAPLPPMLLCLYALYSDRVILPSLSVSALLKFLERSLSFFASDLVI